jgi:2-polyprenyl-3-methyl-5-hydroxy-6-metoxy-1,4-benzoquinol methylase
MDKFKDQFNANREGWNLRTPHHVKSDFYDVGNFIAGATSLRFIEIEELGNIAGKTLLHLMCHFGQDTLSLARMGAEATGIDFSDKAIAAAKSLARKIGSATEFHCCNLYDTRKHVSGQFDIVYTSYGVIGWLPDLREWGRIIAESLKPGGMFYMAEFHPFLWMMDEKREKFAYSYFHSESPLEFEMKGTYTDRTADICYKDFNWIHTLGDVLNALIASGLEIKFLHEFPFSVYDCLPNLEPAGEQRWVFKNLKDTIPYLFSIKAWKK